MNDPLLTTGGPHSPFAGKCDYRDLGVDDRLAIIEFEARTGGKVDAALCWPVIEYYQGLAKWYEMQLQLKMEQATWQTNAGSRASAPLPADSAASVSR